MRLRHQRSHRATRSGGWIDDQADGLISAAFCCYGDSAPDRMVYPAAAATGGGGGLQAGAPFGQHGRAKGMKMRLRFVVALVAIACAASAAGNSLDSGYLTS